MLYWLFLPLVKVTDVIVPASPLTVGIFIQPPEPFGILTEGIYIPPLARQLF